MSECVVRMEMPKNCYVCEMRGAWAFCPIGKWPVVGYKKQRHEDCPIVSVLPEKHGRLVDAELVKEILKPVDSISHYEPEWTWGELHESNCVAIDNAPTIVPAEAERSET